MGWPVEFEYGIHEQSYIELTQNVEVGEHITVDYGEWFDYAQHIDPHKVRDDVASPLTPEPDAVELKLDFEHIQVQSEYGRRTQCVNEKEASAGRAERCFCGGRPE